MTTSIRTERLLLRPWQDEDLAPFAAMNSDPRVMEFFPSLLTREESDAMAERIRNHFAERGFGLWAVEELGGARFIGFVGLAVPNFVAHFTPCVEIGWRLAHQAWGRGYAVEAARASLARGFDVLGLNEIVSMTATTNLRSQRVMTKLGMTRSPADDFDHPKVVEGSHVRRHVLYRLSKADWLRGIGAPLRH